MGRAGTVYTIFNADLSRYSKHRPSILNWIVTPDASFGEIGMVFSAPCGHGRNGSPGGF